MTQPDTLLSWDAHFTKKINEIIKITEASGIGHHSGSLKCGQDNQYSRSVLEEMSVQKSGSAAENNYSNNFYLMKWRSKCPTNQDSTKAQNFLILIVFVPQTFPPKLVLLDFGDMDSMPEAVAEVLECYGCLDILIFNSSMKVKAPAQSVSLEMDKLLMDNNYFGPITLAKGRWLQCVKGMLMKMWQCLVAGLFQACCPPWSPGGVVTWSWSTASKGK